MNDTNYGEKLEILTGLFQQLNAEGFRYCHWKSTHSLDHALKGGTDLDLLLDRKDASRFREKLLRCDFKPFVSAPRRQYPAVEDYLGFDRATGALVHLHVHYRLILGERYTKNYVLPLEDALLKDTRLKSGVRIPSPELEIVILVLRTLLKYRDSDALRDLLRLPGRGGLPTETLKEFSGLVAQTSLERIGATALEFGGDLVPRELVLDFLTTIEKSPRDAATLLNLRRRARKLLAPYRRVGWLQNQLEHYKVAVAHDMPIRRLRDYLLASSHKKPTTGGLGIAFIGMDGAGKSTAVSKIAKWLSWRVNTRVLYMGTTHPTRMTSLARTMSNGGTLLHVASRRIFGKGNLVTRAAEWLGRILTDLRLLAEGKDRYNRYLFGQREIAQGTIVLYDRYPLVNISVDGHPMDGPRINVTGEANQDGITVRIGRAEENLYRTIRLPDRIIVLRVSPEVSQIRKPEHRRERIDAKAQALSDFAHSGACLTEIDAEQPLDQMLLRIKSAIWDWM